MPEGGISLESIAFQQNLTETPAVTERHRKLGEILSLAADDLPARKILQHISTGNLEPVQARTEQSSEHLTLHAYGHPDVLSLFRGDKPKKDPEHPEVSERKMCLIVMGGGQSGVINAGTLEGMIETGAYERTDAIFAVSAGVANTMYAETHQLGTSVSIYWEDNLQPGGFIKIPKKGVESKVDAMIEFVREGPKKPLVDTLKIGDSVRTGKPLDIAKLKASPRKIYAVATDVEMGKPAYLDLCKAEDPIKVMDAAICLEGISSVPSVGLDNGRSYADGGLTDSIPLRKAFDDGYTDVLILANSPIFSNHGIGERELLHVLAAISTHNAYNYPPALIEALVNRQSLVMSEVSFIEQVLTEDNPNRRVAIIEPTNAKFSSLLETDPEVLISDYIHAKQDSHTLFMSKEAQSTLSGTNVQVAETQEPAYG